MRKPLFPGWLRLRDKGATLPARRPAEAPLPLLPLPSWGPACLHSRAWPVPGFQTRLALGK